MVVTGCSTNKIKCKKDLNPVNTYVIPSLSKLHCFVRLINIEDSRMGRLSLTKEQSFSYPAMACRPRLRPAVYESVFVIDNERLVHKVNELKFMVIAVRIRSLQ